MNRSWPLPLTLLICSFGIDVGIDARDAERAHEVLIRGLKLGGTYGQTAYKKQEYSFSSSQAVQNEYNIAYYGPVIGAGVYIAPLSLFHINLGGEINLTFTDAPIQGSTSKSSISAIIYGNLGIRIGDLWPFAGFAYQVLALEPRFVMAQGGLEYRSGNWLFGGLFAQSISAAQSITAAYSDQRDWYSQVYATWLWGKWY